MTDEKNAKPFVEAFMRFIGAGSAEAEITRLRAERDVFRAEVERLDRAYHGYKAIAKRMEMEVDDSNRALYAAQAEVERLTRERDDELAQRLAWEARAESAEWKVGVLRPSLEKIVDGATCTRQSVVAVVNLALIAEARAILAETEANNGD